jgi:predicted ATPase
VLVLDDLHAADAPSLLLLRFLARQVGSMRLLLLGAYRDVDPAPADSLSAMLAEVARESAARRLALDGLSESEVAEYLELTASEMSSPHSIAAGDPDKGLRYSRQAADRALELLAYEEAARLYRLGLEAIDLREPSDASVRCELLLAMGDALTNAGSTADAKQAFLAAGDVARVARLPESFALAALGYGGRSGWQRAAGDPRLVPLLEDALKELGETMPALRARLLARLAGALRDEPSLEPRASISREAVEIARGLGDKDLLAYTLVSHALATWGPQETGTSDAVLDALTLHSLIAWLTLAEGDAATLDDRFNQVAEELGQPADLWQAAMQDVVWALFRGDFAAAEQLAEEALGRGDARRADAACSYRLAMFVLRREQGRLAEIEGLIRDAVNRRAAPSTSWQRRTSRRCRVTPSGSSASRSWPRSRCTWRTAMRRSCSTGCWSPTPR